MSAAALISAGKVRALAMASRNVRRSFRDVPTFTEKGFPQMYARAWWGIVAPAGTPQRHRRQVQQASTASSTIRSSSKSA